MSNPIVRLMNGYISIQRGRVTRTYTPGRASTDRLYNCLFFGPSDHTMTARASVYFWRGIKYECECLRTVYTMFAHYAAEMCLYDTGNDAWRYNFQNWSALRMVCKELGIHQQLWDYTDPFASGFM